MAQRTPKLVAAGLLTGSCLAPCLGAPPAIPVELAAPASLAPGTAPSTAAPPSAAASPSPTVPASPASAPPPQAIVPTQVAPGTVPAEVPPEVLVEAPEPKYVAPTLRDRIGRIWAPVLINGRGPFRLVLDTGASSSAVIEHVVDNLGVTPVTSAPILVRGVTGSALVPSIHVDRMEVGELLMEPATLPIVADVFGGAEGVLGHEGLPDKRIFADFGRDRLVISRSHRERAGPGFSVVPLKLTRDGLLIADVDVGWVHTHAIIDTGAQETVGNLALRNALMRHRPANAKTDEIIGVTLDLQRGDTITAPPIFFGKLQIRQARVTFAEAFLFQHLKMTREPTLLLGMNVLGSFDVLIIDYKMHELQIRTRANALPVRWATP